jgi:hypothetical protein
MIMKSQPDIQEPPFSIELLELFRAFVQATSRDMKIDLAKRIAATFASERDHLDVSASEEYHEFFESYEQALLKYEQQSSRLARLAINLVASHLAQKDVEIDDLLPTVSPAN